MKRLKWLLCITILLISCNTKTKQKSEETVEQMKNVESQDKVIKTEFSAIINPCLLDELNKFIIENASLDKSLYFDTKVINVLFSQEKNHCYVSIFTHHHYDSNIIIGYVILNDNMVVFLKSNICDENFVDITKLNKEKTDKFPDENSDLAKDMMYDGHGKRFKIHSKDSLELVYKGMI